MHNGSIAIGNVRLYIYRHAIDANSVSSDFGGGLRLHEPGSVMAVAWAMPRLRRTRCRLARMLLVIVMRQHSLLPTHRKRVSARQFAIQPAVL